MPLTKGAKLNPNGRPKGAINKTSAEIRAAFQLLVENNLETLQNDIDKLKPDQRIGYILKLSEFFLPKLQSLNPEDQLKFEYMELEKLLEKCPEDFIQKITEKVLNLQNQKENEAINQ